MWSASRTWHERQSTAQACSASTPHAPGLRGPGRRWRRRRHACVVAPTAVGRPWRDNSLQACGFGADRCWRAGCSEDPVEPRGSTATWPRFGARTRGSQSGADPRGRDPTAPGGGSTKTTNAPACSGQQPCAAGPVERTVGAGGGRGQRRGSFIGGRSPDAPRALAASPAATRSRLGEGFEGRRRRSSAGSVLRGSVVDLHATAL